MTVGQNVGSRIAREHGADWHATIASLAVGAAFLGFIVGWLGLWVVFGGASIIAIVSAGLVVLGVALFVLLNEEPTLKKKFGADYEEYCRHVRRWMPRMHAWTNRDGLVRSLGIVPDGRMRA